MASYFITYERDLYSFLTKNKDKKPIDFNNQETEKVTKSLKNLAKKTDEDFRNEIIDNVADQTKILDEEYINYLIKNKKASHERAIQRLKAELEFLDTKRRGINVSSIEETEQLDLSNSTAVEKIIYLHELGIIDFLRGKAKFGISNGKLSSVLSAITGINPNTIKPSLNRLDKKDFDDNKHPYYKPENVAIVKKRITDSGL